MTFKVGLTGGIASGKTTVSRLFAELAVPIIDADEINRQLLQANSPVFSQITQLFLPTDVVRSGELDKPLIKQLIFNNPTLKQQLERLLHPCIQQEMLTAADHCQQPYCILAIPLLIEAKWQSLVDRVLVVDVDEKIQVTRLIKRDGLAPDLIQSILDQQCTREQRIQFADDIINNNSQQAQLEQQVETLHQHYLSLAKM